MEIIIVPRQWSCTYHIFLEFEMRRDDLVEQLIVTHLPVITQNQTVWFTQVTKNKTGLALETRPSQKNKMVNP